jgi:uncharacterized membrane protein
MSGISLYAMALILKVLLGWSMTGSIILSAIIVLVYVGIGSHVGDYNMALPLLMAKYYPTGL